MLGIQHIPTVETNVFGVADLVFVVLLGLMDSQLLGLTITSHKATLESGHHVSLDPIGNWCSSAHRHTQFCSSTHISE